MQKKRIDGYLNFHKSQLSVTDSLAARCEEKLFKLGVCLAQSTFDNHYRKKTHLWR